MSIDATKLRVDLKTGERWKRTMNITVPADLVRNERERATRELATRIKLPGFRKGKIPASVVEKRFGSAVQQETLDKIINDAYREALKSEDLRPISEGEIDDVKYEPDQDLTFAVSFDVNPEIELSRLSGFAVERPAADVGDTEVDGVLERVRDQQGEWEPVDEGTPAEGDLAAVEIERLDGDDEAGAQEYEITIGAEEAIPDVEAAITTLQPGESGEFDIAFPDDFPNEERRGEKQRLRITLKGRKHRNLPALDDDFAKSLGDFESLEALRVKIREDLEKEAADQAEGRMRSQLLDRVLEANSFEVPESMVNRYLDSVLADSKGIPEEKLREARISLRDEAERAVKRMLVIDRIGTTQDLRATEEEIDERIEGIAEQHGANPAEVYGRLQKAGRLEELEREITEQKVFAFLKERSEIVPARENV
jgi:trigger factor